MSLADRSLLLNPWTYVVAVAVLALAFGAGLATGWVVRGWKAGNAGASAVAKTERVEDRRDENIDTIATAAATAAAAALGDNRSTTNESTARIRTVTVPGPCRDVPDPVLRELQAGADAANAALGIGVRPDSARAGAAHPE